MDNGQNRSSVRGPLIAVIKIEIDTNRTDRIFLHQHDNDQQLAQEFVSKHKLNPMLSHHIYERIKYSRESVEQNEQQRRHVSREMTYEDSNYKLQTPVNQLASYRQVQPNVTTSDLNMNHPQSLKKQNGHNKHKSKPTYSYLDEFNGQQIVFTDRKQEGKQKKINSLWMEAPNKQEVLQERQFMIYDNQENEGSQDNSDLALFPQSNIPQMNNQNAYRKEDREIFKSQKVHPVKEINNSSHKSNKILQFLQQKDKQQTLRCSSSLRHFNAPREENIYQSKQKMHTQDDQNRRSVNKEYSKPTHVKILRKEQIESMNQSLKKSMSQNEISRINKDVTRRLYNEGSIKKNYLNIIRQKAKKEKQILNDAQLTHKPQINKISQVIAEGRKKDHLTLEQYLIEEGKKKQTKRAEQQGKKLIEELNGCTFKPQLNVISEKLTADKQELQNRLKMRQSQRRSRYRDQNKFRPELNNITKELMKDKGRFQQRQREFLEIKNSKLLNLVKEKIFKEKQDKQTGQQLFKPKINDLGLRESQGPNIGNYLFALSKIPKEQPQQKPAQPRISSTSEAIVRQMHTNRLTWLFSQLDSDQDGVISSHRIKIETISPEILAIIKPILFEMEQMNQQLNLDQFINAVSVLHKKLNTLQRDKLYGLQKAR